MATNSAVSKKAGAASSKKGLTAKDIVLAAIFGAVTFIIVMAVAMVCSFSVDLCWWAHAIGSIPAGIVWAYIMNKIPKTGSAIIAGAVMALLGLLMGMVWTGPAGILLGAVLCEAIMYAGKRSKISQSIGFAVMIFVFWLCHVGFIFVIGIDQYTQMMLAMGMDYSYASGVATWVTKPVFYIAGVCTLIAAFVGDRLGLAIFKKHFAKING